MSVLGALVIARLQLRELGSQYPGGLECTVYRATRLPRFEALAGQQLAKALTPLELATLELHVEIAGYRVEGPCVSDAVDPELEGRYWWTLGRPGWSGYEVSRDDWAAREDAVLDAARSMQIELSRRGRSAS